MKNFILGLVFALVIMWLVPTTKAAQTEPTYMQLLKQVVALLTQIEINTRAK